MKLHNTLGLFVFSAVLALASCSGSGGDKYVGSWTLVYDHNGPDTLKVDERRGNIIVDIDKEGHYSRHWESQADRPVPLAYDKEKDQMIHQDNGITELLRYDPTSKKYFVEQSGVNGDLLMEVQKVK